MAGHVVNPSTKFENPTAIHSWVMSSDISRRLPLTMRLQPLRMRRHITWPMCRGKFFPHIWNTWPWFAYSLYNFYGATIKTDGVIHQNSVVPCVKDHMAVCACAKPRQSSTLPQILYHHRSRRPRFPVDCFKFWHFDSIYGNFGHIFTAHAQKRLFMNFRLKLWHHHSIPWLRFPYRARYFGDLRTFSVDFCIG